MGFFKVCFNWRLGEVASAEEFGDVTMNWPKATFGHGCEQLRAKDLATLYRVLSRGPAEIRVVGVLPIGHSRTIGGA